MSMLDKNFNEEYSISEGSKVLENNLIKKHHANLVYDYTEYPTKGHWSESFSDEDYKNCIVEWFPKIKQTSFILCTYTILRTIM